MRPKDVAPSVEIVAQHPFISPRYAGTLCELRPVWLSLLGREAFRSYVYEDLQDSPPRLVGLGCSAIISDEFLLEAKTPPFFWIGPELTRRISCGCSPLLSDKQVRDANCDGGLNVAVWEGAMSTRDMNRVELSETYMSTLMELHRGLQLKELIAQGNTEDVLDCIPRGGFLFISSANGQYTEMGDRPTQQLIREPHVTGLSRELALTRRGTWASALFVYQPPRFGFSPSEQRLLATALLGGTDEDLADELGISLSAVKKAWHSIYERVSTHDPELVPRTALSEEGSSGRGKGKKQRLIAYMRDHPEELRPAAP
jgi:DNA-binding CsgD family transcriptional regulator